jgi:hypothetical protein
VSNVRILAAPQPDAGFSAAGALDPGVFGTTGAAELRWHGAIILQRGGYQDNFLSVKACQPFVQLQVVNQPTIVFDATA